MTTGTSEFLEETAAKVFVSYARKDLAFVERLEAALRARGIAPLIDKTEIFAFDEWWKRIEALIAQADTVVFVISADSVASQVCGKELAFAQSLNKRLAPIVWRRVDDKDVPEALARINYIFFDGDADFDARVDNLAEALTTDIVWVRKHTEFGEAARRWTAAGRPGPRGLLLRSPTLEEAEQWIASRPPNAPPPTEDLQGFIAESRRAATQRRNILTASLGTAFVVALALASLAFWQRGIAIEQERLAKQRQVNMLSELARGELLRANFDRTLRFGVHALRLALSWDSAAAASSAGAVLANTTSQLEWQLSLGGHTAAARFSSFNIDGTRLVTVSYDNTARIWDTSNGAEIAVLRGHTGNLVYAAFNRDGTRVVTYGDGYDGTTRIWDAKTGAAIVVLRGVRDISRDWSLFVVSGGFGFEASVRAVATGSEIARLHGHQGMPSYAIFNSDGTRVLTASDSDNTVRLWDASTGRELAAVRGVQFRAIGTIYPDFSPEGSRFAVIMPDNSVRIWDARKATAVTTLPGQKDIPVDFVVFSRDATRVVTVTGPVARMWDAATGKPVAVLRGSEAVIRTVAFNADGSRILTTGDDSIARIWDAKTGNSIGTLPAASSRASFSSDGSKVVGARDRSASVVDAATGKEVAVLRGHEGEILSATLNSSGSQVSTTSNDKTVRIWNISRKEGPLIFRGDGDQVNSVAFSPDGSRLATASWDKTVRVWDAANGRELMALRGHEKEVGSVAFRSDGMRLVTASSDQTARLWDAATGKELRVLRGHGSSVYSASFSPDGSQILTASADRTARIWDATSGNLIRALDHPSDVHFAAYSPDGSRVVTVFSWEARIFDARSGTVIGTLTGHEATVASAAFSPDETRIVTASWDKTARIWDARSYKEVAVLRGHADNVVSAVFSPDGGRVATASWDKTARIWDSASGREILTLRGHDGFLFSVAFPRDGSHIATASGDKTARVWDLGIATLSTKDTLAEICLRRINGVSVLGREEMRMAGYTDDAPEIDVCEGVH